jgi:hypothetical protein
MARAMKALGLPTISKKELARHKCNDCGVNVIEIGEYYMLNPQIWEDHLGLEWSDNLCIGCLEKRLGRKVGPLFIEFCSIPNYKWIKPPSDRLLDRYGFEKDKKGKWRWKLRKPSIAGANRSK